MAAQETVETLLPDVRIWADQHHLDSPIDAAHRRCFYSSTECSKRRIAFAKNSSDDNTLSPLVHVLHYRALQTPAPHRQILDATWSDISLLPHPVMSSHGKLGECGKFSRLRCDKASFLLLFPEGEGLERPEFFNL